ncbi:hypothetical protein GCM10022268_00070 [Sphingomonas cynarae]|uniref:Type I restriction modification DNA specificity domain-containing protein n=1 Tax=Sphingomonas cynarae TaxID=930197 RepID=A0ABP7CQE5_9SPHN
MMENWPRCLLPEVVTFQEGPGILAKDFHETGIPLVRLSGLGGYEVTLDGCNYVSEEKGTTKWKHFRLNKGDILISTSASFGRPAVVGDEAVGALFYTGIIRFRSSSPRLDEGYLKLFLGSQPFSLQASAVASGSVIQHYGPSHLKRMTIDLPPIVVQRHIAAVISAIDEKIELNRQTNETLEASARALFRDWFVDFGPTRAKAEGRPAYLAPDLWSLFPGQLGIDGVPEGWSVYTLGDLADQHTGSINPARSGDEVFEHYSLPAFDNGASPSLDRGDTIKSNKTLLPANAVLLSKLNPEISRVWMPTSAKDAKQVASTEFLTFVPRAPAGRSLLFAMFRDATFRQIMEGMVTGTSKSHQRISPPALRAVNALTGAPAIFEAFERFASPMMEQMLANRIASRSLAGTRDALLPEMMSGKIRVADVRSQASTSL